MSRWAIELTNKKTGKRVRGVQFRRLPGRRVRWTFWRNSFPSKAAARARMKQYIDARDAAGKPIWSGRVYEINPKLWYTPEEWGSAGTAPGYEGTPISLKGKYTIPHYGAIGDVKGPRTKKAEVAMVQAFEHHHLHVNGWPGGLGYHVVVAQSGNAYLSVRGEQLWRGAHTGNEKNLPGDPNSNLGICLLVGNNEVPSPAALAKVKAIRKHFKVGRKVRYHKEFDYTSCPGVVIPQYIK